MYKEDKLRGPAHFLKGITKILPYKNDKCIFISNDNLNPLNVSNESDYFFLPYETMMSEESFDEWIKVGKVNKLIIGPMFVPSNWFNFPNKKYWKERNYRKPVSLVKRMAVHSVRIKNYLTKRANITDLDHKYVNLRACTNLRPKYVKPFKDRTIDIIFFEKYADSNRRQQGKELFNLLNSKKKVEKLIYGLYNKEIMMRLANNTKFIVYFSFYDTGAIGLKEIQNFGVYAFSLQKDLAFDNETSSYIPELEELDMKKAYQKIIKKIDDLTRKNPNSEYFAKINQDYTKCENVYEDLCNSLLK